MDVNSTNYGSVQTTPPGEARPTFLQTSPQGFTSLASLGRAVVILLAIYCVFAGLEALTDAVQITQLGASPVQQTGAAVASSSSLPQMIGDLAAIAQLPAIIATSILFLIWYFRAYRNLPALGAQNLMATPGWTVAWFFIPIACLVRPFEVTREMWKASDPGIQVSDSATRNNMRTWSVLGWWWAFWLLSVVADRMVFNISIHPETVNALTSAQVSLGAGILDVLAGIFAILVVREITRRQEEKYRRLPQRV